MRNNNKTAYNIYVYDKTGYYETPVYLSASKDSTIAYFRGSYRATWLAQGDSNFVKRDLKYASKDINRVIYLDESRIAACTKEGLLRQLLTQVKLGSSLCSNTDLEETFSEEFPEYFI